MLLAAADDYLLELCRTDLEAQWRHLHPDGEVLVFDTPPAANRLDRELNSPSLFAPARLLVVRDASSYFNKTRGVDPEALVEVLDHSRLADTCLLLAARVKASPEGPLADAIRRAGEVRFLPLPEEPKPWERQGLTPAQRQVLHDLLRRTLPDLKLPAETVDALCEAYGFKPRELVQAASRLALAGDLSPEAVRMQAGPGECVPRELEDALISRNGKTMAGILARLSAGAVLMGWQNEALDPAETGPFLVRLLGRLLRQALAVRCLAEEVGLGQELDRTRCSGDYWYPRTFKPSILPRLQAAIKADESSTLEKLTPWQLHRLFRLAAAYTSNELMTTMAGLFRANLERERHRDWALGTISSVLLGLIGPSAPKQRAAAG